MEEERIEVPIPGYWTPWDTSNKLEVNLDPSSNEFKEIWSHFRDSIRFLDQEKSLNPRRVPRYIGASPVSIKRIQNYKLWTIYHNKRLHLRDSLQADDHFFPRLSENARNLRPNDPDFVPPVLSGFPWSTTHFFDDRRINEVRLWHGTSHQNSELISQTGFDPRYAALEGRLGAGLYFADCVPKSFDYTSCPVENCRTNRKMSFTWGHCNDPEHKKKPRIIILSRVLLGKPNITLKSMRQIRLAPNGRDSIIAPSKHVMAKSGFWFSEYTVYEKDNTYPEYIIEWLPDDPDLAKKDQMSPAGLKLPHYSPVSRDLKLSIAAQLPKAPAPTTQSAAPKASQVPNSTKTAAPKYPAPPKVATPPPHSSTPPPSENYSVFVQKAAPAVDIRDMLTKLGQVLSTRAPGDRTLAQILSAKSVEFYPQLRTIIDQPFLIEHLSRRVNAPQLGFNFPAVLSSRPAGGPLVEDVIRTMSGYRLSWDCLAAAVAHLDPTCDSVVDLAEFQQFHLLFGPNYLVAVQGLITESWFRPFDKNDAYLTGKPPGSFVVRGNSSNPSRLTLALVEAGLTAPKKVVIEPNPATGEFKIQTGSSAISATNLRGLLQQMAGVEFNAPALPKTTHLLHLILNFRSRLSLYAEVISKFSPITREQFPNIEIFNDSLEALAHHISTTFRPDLVLNEENAPVLLQGLLDHLLAPLVMEPDLAQAFSCDKAAQEFGKLLFGQTDLLSVRLTTHPLIRCLAICPWSQEIVHCLAMANILKLIGGIPTTGEISETFIRVRRAVTAFVTEEGRFALLKQNQSGRDATLGEYLRLKLKELHDAVGSFTVNTNSRDFRRAVDNATYDLLDGYDQIEALELPPLWAANFAGKLVIDVESVVNVFKNYFGAALGEDKEVLAQLTALLQRRPSLHVGTESNSVSTVTVAVFASLLSWLGDLPHNASPSSKKEKLEILKEFVAAPWFLGFVSRSFSGLNLSNHSSKASPGLFYARVSNLNPSLITIDYIPKGDTTVKRARLQAPGGVLIDGEPDFNWSLPDAMGLVVERAPSVVQLVRNLMKVTEWSSVPAAAITAQEEWFYEAQPDSSDYVGYVYDGATDASKAADPPNESTWLLLLKDLETMGFHSAPSLVATIEEHGAELLKNQFVRRGLNEGTIALLFDSAQDLVAAMPRCERCNPPLCFERAVQQAAHLEHRHGLPADETLPPPIFSKRTSSKGKEHFLEEGAWEFTPAKVSK